MQTPRLRASGAIPVPLRRQAQAFAFPGSQGSASTQAAALVGGRAVPARANLALKTVTAMSAKLPQTKSYSRIKVSSLTFTTVD